MALFKALVYISIHSNFKFVNFSIRIILNKIENFIEVYVRSF
jgi:hypothetical protein